MGGSKQSGQHGVGYTGTRTKLLNINLCMNYCRIYVAIKTH